MGIFNTILGNVKSTDVEDIERDFEEILYEGEKIEYAFSYVRDVLVFTDTRVIFVDKQGVTGKKKLYHSIPYKSIIHFNFESSGHLDDDCELRLYIHGSKEPVIKEFQGEKNIKDVQRIIARAIS